MDWGETGKSSSLPFARYIRCLCRRQLKGETGKSSSLPFARGGLGWGKTRIYQLFPTSVYTVVPTREGGRGLGFFLWSTQLKIAVW